MRVSINLLFVVKPLKPLLLKYTLPTIFLLKKIGSPNSSYNTKCFMINEKPFRGNLNLAFGHLQSSLVRLNEPVWPDMGIKDVSGCEMK